MSHQHTQQENDAACSCGHEHHSHAHHDHASGEACSCGHVHHHHDHEECTDPNCSCHEQHCETEKLPGIVYTQVKLHDDAKVVSGSLTLVGDYETIRRSLSEGLKEFAAAVTERGGLIGHIKASAKITGTEMFSVTETEVMIKPAPEQQIDIVLAAIVFFLSEEEAEQLARKALEAACPPA